MFHAMPMQRLSIHLIAEDVPMAALQLAASGCFAPDEKILPGQAPLSETPGDEYREVYRAARSRLDKIMDHLGSDLPLPELVPDRVPDIGELEKVNEWLTAVWGVCSTCEENHRRLDERERLINNLENSLQKFTGLDLDLGQLRKQKSFLDLQVGVVPEENLIRLHQAARLAGYILNIFHRQHGQAYVVIAGMLDQRSEELRLVLNAAGYHALPIPAEFHDRPEQLRAELQKEKQQIQQDRELHQGERQQHIEEYREGLQSAWQTLKLIEPYVSLGRAARSQGGLAVINGWMPADQVQSSCRMLRDAIHHPCYIESTSPAPREYPEVPTAVRYPGWLMPFARLVRNYGTPRYGEFDPTWVFAISSIAMFGMMFGDIGHGSVIAVLALVFWNRLLGFGSFVLANGLSSMLFGFLYGSIFGDEHLIEPLWRSPLADPAGMLLLALYLGVGFIALMILLNIYNQIVECRYQAAWLAANGAAGLLLIAALFLTGRTWLSGEALEITHLLMLLAPLGMILYYAWRHNHMPLTEKPIVVAIELFEAVIGLVSNTLSFLRVAAFSLNHVALMIAVFTIANMLDTVGHWLTLVVGNVFVIGFEGAIVVIQVLRLEYYEGLSRFFHGDGKSFRPLTLSEGTPLRCYV